MQSNIFSIFDRYSIRGLFGLFCNLIYTKSILSSARLIRRPFYLRGRKYIKFGKNLTTGVGFRLEANPVNKNSICIHIGDNVQVNDYVHIGSVQEVYIGNNVLIASKVFITDHNHGDYTEQFLPNSSAPFVPPYERPIVSKPVRIEDNVWLGEFVTVLPGVSIGSGSIIGSMSVVTKNIPRNSIAVGIPARVIKVFNMETQQWQKING